MKKIALFLAASALCGIMTAQESEKSSWGIKFSGFVNTDYFIDSRQIVSARQGHFLLWPAAEKLDPNGEDINAQPSFNILSIRTRLRGTISGPDVLGAKTSAIIEGSFFGHSNTDLNGFRLRHAFAKMNWENTELLVGQTWHPMFITSCFPGVLSFNTGAPFAPFARNPQIRITHDLGPVSISATALAHADFYTAAGIAGLRNSVMPEMHLQLWYMRPSTEDMTGILLGGGAGFKRIVPVIETELGYKTNSGLGSFTAELYGKLTFNKLTWKVEGAWGQNNYDILMLGSYAVTSIDGATGIMQYTPTSAFSGWTEIHSNNTKWQPGLFAGYTKNLGANQDISAGSVAGTRGDIDFIYRISPRMAYNVGKMRFGIELEYTVAAFGTINRSGQVENSKAVGNLRTLLSIFYFF
jgi:hypothetical protein